MSQVYKSVETGILTGKALDWAVCRARYPTAPMSATHVWLNTSAGEESFRIQEISTDWALGGLLIDREKISIRQWPDVPIVNAYMPGSEWSSDAQSPLIAACRAYVYSKLGPSLEIPEKLSV